MACAKCWATTLGSTGGGGIAAVVEGRVGTSNVRVTVTIPATATAATKTPIAAMRTLCFMSQSCRSLPTRLQESARLGDSLGKTDAQHRRLGRQRRQEPAGAGGVKDDENALIALAAD